MSLEFITSMLAFQASARFTHPWAASPLSREKWPLSKEPFLTLTWIAFDWLIYGLNLMSNLELFFKSYSFYQMISNHYLELEPHLHLEFDLHFQIWVPNLYTKYIPQSMPLYSFLVMLLDQFKTKLRYLNHL
jgi:hypothetical protein